jgi:DNA-directed RNA polymerase beta subunit
MMRSDIISVYKLVINEEEEHVCAEGTAKIRTGEYSPDIGTRISPGDVVIMTNKQKVMMEMTDLSGRVQDVRVIDLGEKQIEVQVKIVSVCVPMIGDKFSSRHAQKGTVSMMYRQEDMPYSAQTGILYISGS